ncbi:hypothetical protein SAMN04488096_10673 [Mesonia phycicola]|uniref:Uncharacterized protein n=1 Tax=Mesonia phycicola TaxID=579105 RepID=A0A1M6FCQ4_9FLAO|nr:hypothetical protein [Mesonia phycicola]SHI95500.1 hypothetical protein SAMN04488096_10673 [Mesonia phycicola]
MAFAYPVQRLQDWLTQQWVISFGKKININKHSWLIGPFGSLNITGEGFINQLAEKENLVLERELPNCGLIRNIEQLNLPEEQVEKLSKKVIDFYVNTSNYNLGLKVTWNPFFKIFGFLLQFLFSNRLKQLNIPTKTIKDTDSLKSEIINLVNPITKRIKYTFWYRTFKTSGEVIYSGIYGTCTIPSGKTCIKAIFPLPNGNATVILEPYVGEKGELILKSSGKKVGDSGFYFLLKDVNNTLWLKYIKSFKDQLIVSEIEGELIVEQKLTLWGINVLKFNYLIQKKQSC